MVLKNQCACAETDLVRRRSESLVSTRRNFCEKVVNGLKGLPTEIRCPMDDSMFVKFTLGEDRYLRTLRDIPEEGLDGWRGVSCVEPVAWVRDRPQLRI